MPWSYHSFKDTKRSKSPDPITSASHSSTTSSTTNTPIPSKAVSFEQNPDAEVLISVSDLVRPKSLSKEMTMKRKDDEFHHMHILGIDIGHWPRVMQLIVCSAAVFFFYIVYAYLQELIFKLDGMQPLGWYLTLIQFAQYSTFGYMEMSWRGVKRKIPMTVYLQLAFYTVGAMGLSNASVGYLNYPTMVIFKCCKLIPVLIGGILIQGKQYGSLDFGSAVLMSGGLIYFVLVDNKISPNFNPYGYMLISTALVFDAIIGNVQEKKMKHYGASNMEMVFYSYTIGCVYIFVGLIVTDQFSEAFWFFLEHPWKTYGYITFFSITGYFGINVVLTLVKNFDAFIAVTVTTCRKAVTIILSFMFFAKPFSIQYVYAGLIVMAGIYLNVYSKNRERWNAKIVVFMKYLVTKVQQQTGPARSDVVELV